jgi:hypothetical protein
MIDRYHELSVSKQADLVGIARSTVYYLQRPVTPADDPLIEAENLSEQPGPPQPRLASAAAKG